MTNSSSSSATNAIISSSSSSSVPSPLALSHVVSSPAIGEKLDGNNYVVWKTLLIPFLRANQLMPIVDGTERPPPKTITIPSTSAETPPTEQANPAYATWLTRDQTALRWLLATSTPSIITQLSSHSSAASVWAYLAASYAAQSSARTTSLRLQLQAIRKGNRSVTEYIREASALYDQLQSVGEPVSAS